MSAAALQRAAWRPHRGLHGTRAAHTPRATPSPYTLRRIRVIPAGGLPAADLQAISDWIRLNEAAIVAFWEGRIFRCPLARRLPPLP